MPTSSACTIKSLASCGNPSFSARDLALFCADTAGGLPRMKRSRKSESETVFIFIKRPEQLHVRIMTILPTKIEDSYRIRCFLKQRLCFKGRTQALVCGGRECDYTPNTPMGPRHGSTVTSVSLPSRYTFPSVLRTSTRIVDESVSGSSRASIQYDIYSSTSRPSPFSRFEST